MLRVSCFVLVRFFSLSSGIFLQKNLPQTQNKILPALACLADAKDNFAAWARRRRQKQFIPAPLARRRREKFFTAWARGRRRKRKFSPLGFSAPQARRKRLPLGPAAGAGKNFAPVTRRRREKNFIAWARRANAEKIFAPLARRMRGGKFSPLGPPQAQEKI